VRMTIEFDNEQGTSGTIMTCPLWIGRLIGRKPRVAHIYFSDVTHDWRFADGGWVGSALEQRINDERRWRTVKSLPAARALEPAK